MTEQTTAPEAESTSEERKFSLSFAAWVNLGTALAVWEICFLYPTSEFLFFPGLSDATVVNAAAYFLEVLMLVALILEMYSPEKVAKAWEKLSWYAIPERGSLWPPAARDRSWRFKAIISIGFTIAGALLGAITYELELFNHFAGGGITAGVLAIAGAAAFAQIFTELFPNSSSTLQWGAGFGISSLAFNSLLFVM